MHDINNLDTGINFELYWERTKGDDEMITVARIDRKLAAKRRPHRRVIHIPIM